jgi:regulator of replication initiation timing
MSQHTPEPWPIPDWGGINDKQDVIRAVTCVNACRDMADPEEEIRAMKQCIHDLTRGNDDLAKENTRLTNRIQELEADPAKEISQMRDLIETIANRSCEVYRSIGKTCLDYPSGAPEDYCPSCLARHTLGGGK